MYICSVSYLCTKMHHFKGKISGKNFPIPADCGLRTLVCPPHIQPPNEIPGYGPAFRPPPIPLKIYESVGKREPVNLKRSTQKNSVILIFGCRSFVHFNARLLAISFSCRVFVAVSRFPFPASSAPPVAYIQLPV